MDIILRGYHVNEPTWFYLSFLLITAVFFKFTRLWSVRNLDLALLLLISPGLLFLRHELAAGYVWLFGVSALLLGRTLLDGVFTRRSPLDQNLNAAGLTFLCFAAFAFLMTRAITEPPPSSTVESVRRANQLLNGTPAAAPAASSESASAGKSDPTPPAGPGSPLLMAPVAGLSKVVGFQTAPQVRGSSEPELIAARSIAILAHLAVIIGLILVGRQIFGMLEVGIAMATLYLLLPCTAYDVGKVNHVLPSALVVWAVWAFRMPLVSGMLLGLACGTLFFPIFLLPLWASFYGRRGALRFCSAVVLVTAAILGSRVFGSPDSNTFVSQTLTYMGLADLTFQVSSSTEGFWSHYESAYRIPVFVAFLVMLVALTIWPRRKNLSQLMAHSAAIVIGTQFWYPQQGGVYVLWYLPLLLLVMLRPALANHFAPELKPLNWLWKTRTQQQKHPSLTVSAMSLTTLGASGQRRAV